MRAPATGLTLASGCAKLSGMSVVWTGVIPPKEVLPPQNAFAADAARRGDDGRSFCVFGVTSDELVVARVAGAGMGPGGGSAGDSARPAQARRDFLSPLISCLKAAFSDWLEPSSVRMASIRRSRSAMSPSSVVMYSTCTFVSYGGHEKVIISPLRRTRKLRALILLRSCRFSLLDIFLYSSGEGRQSSPSSLGSSLSLTTADTGAFF